MQVLFRGPEATECQRDLYGPLPRWLELEGPAAVRDGLLSPHVRGGCARAPAAGLYLRPHAAGPLTGTAPGAPLPTHGVCHGEPSALPPKRRASRPGAPLRM